MQNVDVAIVGGGPAGLSAALVLARARWRVAVFDAGTPRNAVSPGVQGFLSRDGTHPTRLRRIAREQIDVYGSVRFEAAWVTDVRPLAPSGFALRTRERHEPVHADLVLLAVGMVDVYPAIEGFTDLWGRGILHCAFCHGWENSGRAWGIVARSAQDVEGAIGFCPWSDDLMVFCPPDLDIPDAIRRSLERRAIPVERRAIRRVIGTDEGELTAVELEDGERIARGALVYRPVQRQTALVRGLGVALDANGRVEVDEHRETSIRGIYAGGDLAPGCQDVASATAAGAAIGKQMTRVLVARRVASTAG